MLCFSVDAQAQDQQRIPASEQVIEFGGLAGPLLKIYPGFPESAGTRIVELNWRGKGGDANARPWQRAYNFPETGVSITHLSFGNDSILGSGLGAQYRFVQRHPINKRLTFVKGLGEGMLWVSDPYHYQHNPSNIAMGSHLSALMSLHLGLRYRILTQWQVQLGGAFVHASNAHTTLPNVGLNVPALQASVLYSMDWEQKSWQSFPKHKCYVPLRWEKVIRLGLGVNEFGTSTDPTNGPKYPIYLLSAFGSKARSQRSHLQLGANLYYNSGYRSFLESQETGDLTANFGNASVVVLFVGHEYRYHRFGMVVQGGYNLWNPFLKHYQLEVLDTGDKVKSKVAGRYGVNYYLRNPWAQAWSSNMYLGIYVKSNTGQADFLDMGIGLTF